MSRLACLRPGGVALTAELLAGTDLQPPDALLDGGCGQGMTVSWLRDQGYKAWGIDRKAGTGAWLDIGEMTALPWPAAVFDGYLAECSLSICGDVALALREAWRVLRPGGWLMLSDVYTAHSGEQLPTLEQWHLLVQSAGFAVAAIEDRSAVWKPFVIEAIWAGVDMETLWCGMTKEAGAGSKLGYLTLLARKPR